MINLSIIIVNYKTPELVLDCLRTIKCWEDRVGYEVIVIDNSPDNSGESILKKVYPEVIWYSMHENAGFARANNKGIELAKGEVCLLLNSDTLIVNDAIQCCYESFVSSENVACGVQLLNPDNTPQISGNYFMKGSLNNLLPLPFIGSFLKYMGQLVGVQKPHIPNAVSESSVDWINGAFLMVRKSVIKLAGLLDPDFFLYAEEAEWCSRLSKFGPLVIYGQFNVVHLQGETANKSFATNSKGYYDLYSKKGLQIMLSNLLRIRKQFGVFWLLFHFAMLLFEVPLFFLLTLLQSLIRFKNPLSSFRYPVLYVRNVFRLLYFLPKLVPNKPFFYKVL